MPKGRSRLIRRLLLSAALGMLTNIAVAWSIALWLPPLGRTVKLGTLQLADNSYSVVTARGIATAGFLWSELNIEPPVFPQNAEPHWIPSWASRRPGDPILEYPNRSNEFASGFPMLSFSCSFGPSSQDVVNGAFPRILSYRFRTGPMLSERRALPLRPIWTGIVVNSILYGGLWWLVLYGREFLRSRRAPHACLSCGYDLKGLAPTARCPECGAANSTATKSPEKTSTQDA